MKAEIGWVELAVCRGMDPDLFFPERGESCGTAKAVCSGCPVAAACAQYARDHGITHGIWGGLSEQERRALRRHPQDRVIEHGTTAGYNAEIRYKLGTCPACRAAQARRSLDAERRRNPIVQSPVLQLVKDIR